MNLRPLACSWLIALGIVAAIPLAGMAQTQTIDFGANAYGTQIFVGSTIISGKTATSAIGCTPQTGLVKTNTVASVSVPPTLSTGAVTTSASTVATAASSSADIAQVNLISGLVTANEVKAVSTTSQDASGLHTSAAGSIFSSLLVAGIPVGDNPAPNTVISLPLLGNVTLNEQTASVSQTSARLTVNMIHIRVTVANLKGLQIGTEIIVGSAQSSITLATTPAILDGQAFGSEIVLQPVLVSGPTALAIVPCLGSKGQVVTNTTAGINIVGELSTGTVTDTAQGAIASSAASSATTSTVQAANLVNSLLTADVITAAANASTTDGQTFNFTDTGSTFLNLAVAGHPEINDQVAPNTRVNLVGVGTLWLHRIVQSSNNIEVRMVELIIAQGNVIGLPVGTDIRIADASASLHSATHP